MMTSWDFWRGPAIRLGLLSFAALLAGLIAGAAWGWAIMAIGAFILVVIQLRLLQALARWVEKPAVDNIPDGWGAWESVFSVLYRRERVRAFEQRNLEALLRQFDEGAAALPDGVIALDAEDRIVWSNARANRYFELDPSGDRGTPLANLVRRPALVEYLKLATPEEPLVLTPTHADDPTLAVSLVPFSKHNRLLIVRDISDSVKIERVRRDFVANVSHELKTPLAVIAGFVEHLVDDDAMAPGDRKKMLSLMQEQTVRLTRLTDDLLILSGLEGNTAQPVDEPIDMRHMLAELVVEAQGLSRGRHTISGQAAQLGLLGSAKELRSAFVNLVTNALRYTPEGGRIELIWSAEPDGGARFSVKDTGIGIEPEHIARLTERFYRVDPGRSRENLIAGGGTGLGLAIVKHALLRHHARLDVQSVPGEGSTFSAVFPKDRVAAIDHQSVSEAAA